MNNLLRRVMPILGPGADDLNADLESVMNAGKTDFADKAQPATKPDPAPRRAVVIDDNRDAADSTAMLITVLGGEVHVAYDGEAGLREVVNFHPDIVFLDLGMPGMDGFETCRRIRREVGASTFVVALTGWGQEHDRRATKAAGFDVHLTKPADPKVIESLLANPHAPPGRV
ncbi:MAG: response regulator [Vicinamibacteria bacterium]